MQGSKYTIHMQFLHSLMCQPSMGVCVYVRVCMYMPGHICMYICMYACMRACVCVYVCVCACVHTYVCTCLCMYVHI